jgi:uncharacterized Zn finger protein
MSATPKCPHCGSIELPEHVQQEHDVTTVLVLYCANCGSILAAADYFPHYPGPQAPASRPGASGA